ncbi:MAG TPA: hypothetical protein VK787_06350, partial [Puia sp.]|nr:hypothetical protein [Puia sp.]
MDDKKNIKHYSAADIQNYVVGKLSAAEMYAIEKAALDDPFLADAIEGMENSIKQHGSASLNADINELQRRLSDRITEKRKAKVIAINRIRWQVAATLLIFTATGVLTYNYFDKNKFENKNIAQTEAKKPDTDSIIVNKNDSVVQSKPQSLSDSNADVAINEKRIEKKEKQKVHRVSIKSNVAPKEKITDTLADDKNADASASSLAVNNKKFETDNLSNNNDASNKLATAKNITAFDKSNNANEFVGKVVDVNSQPISGAYVNIV